MILKSKCVVLPGRKGQGRAEQKEKEREREALLALRELSKQQGLSG